MLFSFIVRTGIFAIFVFIALHFMHFSKTSAAGTIIAQDTFKRANRSGWGTASDGQKWLQDGQNGAFYSINNNTGQVANSGGSTYNAIIGPTVGDSEVFFSGYVENSYKNGNMGAIIRWQDDLNWYKAYIGGDNSGDNGTTIQLQKFVKGVYTDLQDVSFTASPGTNYSLRFNATGNTFKVKVWKTSNPEPAGWNITYTDSKNLWPTGNIGLRTLPNTQSYNTIVHYTSFIAYDLSSKCPCFVKGTVLNTSGGVQGATVTAMQGINVIQTAKTDSAGDYALSGMANGNYTIVFSGPPVGNTMVYPTNSPPTWAVSIGSPCILPSSPLPLSPLANCDANGDISELDFQYQSVPKYHIAGVLFNDTDGDGIYQVGSEGPYLGTGQQVHVVGQTTGFDQMFPISSVDGSYDTGVILLPDTYQVSYIGGPPSGYFMTEPLASTPPTFSLIVGPPCTGASTGASLNASCSGGNITNVDFGITNAKPWIQSVCGDIRIDTGITDAIPLSPTCGSVSGAYAIQTKNAVCPLIPAVAFSGNVTPDYNKGTASSKNWSVGDSVLYGELFSPETPGVIKTSFAYLQATAKQAGIPLNDLSKFCNINNCDISTLPRGIYIAYAPLTTVTTAQNLAVGKNIVVLITGNFYIKGDIDVPVGTSLVFSSSADIHVNPSVGEGSVTSTSGTIGGIYSADGSFIVDGNGPSTCTDKRLNIEGSVIVNAAQLGGSFQYLQRTLCKNNLSCPVVGLISRPDFLLNEPAFLKSTHSVYQEVAP